MKITRLQHQSCLRQTPIALHFIPAIVALHHTIASQRVQIALVVSARLNLVQHGHVRLADCVHGRVSANARIVRNELVPA